MLKMPYNPIANLEADIAEDRIEKQIEWDNRPTIHVVSNLPTDASSLVKNANAFLDNRRLQAHVLIKVQ